MANCTIKSYKELFKESLGIYSSRCFSLLAIILVFLIPTFLIFYLAIYNYSFGETVVRNSSQFVYQIIFIVLAVFIWLFSYLSMGAHIKYVSGAYHNKPISILDSYTETFNSYVPYFVANIVFSFRVLLWGLCLFFPGVYFAMLYNYGPMIVLLEGRSAKDAIKISASYVKPNLVKYLDYLLLTLVIGILCSVPFFIVFDFLIDLVFAREWWRIGQVFDFFEVLVFLMVLQFTFVFYYVLFEELKKKEGESGHS